MSQILHHLKDAPPEGGWHERPENTAGGVHEDGGALHVDQSKVKINFDQNSHPN
jgi:hypothetical protein